VVAIDRFDCILIFDFSLKLFCCQLLRRVDSSSVEELSYAANGTLGTFDAVKHFAKTTPAFYRHWESIFCKKTAN
jgi:hypothetical protein